jgi:peptidoglycan/xylan/chitin deacetylase (PgdA/CDA1 family)
MTGRTQRVERTVVITVDDLPGVFAGNDWVPVNAKILAALRKHHVSAVGFVTESRLYVNGAIDASRVAILESWLRDGHELGNHTFAHRSANFTPLTEYLAGIARGERVTRALARRAGRPFRYFRHPLLHAGRSMAYRHSVEGFLAEHGYTIAPVTVDNQDWMYARAYLNLQRPRDSVLRRRVVGDYFRHLDSAFAYSESLSHRLFGHDIPLVLLLHASRINADHLDNILTRLEARGYRFATLEKALADPAYRSADNYTGPIGPSWLVRWALTRGIQPPKEPREEAYITALASQP